MDPPLVPSDPPTPADLHREKLAWARTRPGAPVPSNVAWVEGLPAAERAARRGAPIRRPTRTLSGVAIVAVMTAPAPCPHGRCTYCPGGVALGSPQSYTGEEPSALRGAQFGYDPRAITAHRLEALETIGHPTGKVEAIVMGGTFTARPVAYQRQVLHGIFDGVNGSRSASLEAAQAANEAAARRLVSLTVETRPDGVTPENLGFLLASGVTRIEIGVECLRDPVLADVGRAHGLDAVRRATRLARDFGVKLAYHMMPGLPGMTPERDAEDLARLFDDPTLKPDMVKLYPTLVIAGTPLHDAWAAGAYRPYDTPTAVALLARAKARFPPWVRVQRIQRDIPARLIADGVRHGNLRELVHRRMASDGTRCRCLRCREVGRRASPPPDRFEPIARQYPVEGGTEHLLSWEDSASDTIAAFLRLHVPDAPPEVGVPGPVIRELKALGPELPVGALAPASAYQHRGFGRRLLAAAERVAAQAGYRRLWVTSAVGTRPYYRRFGYSADGPHMAKPVFP
ncbi:MAG TPA: tRNA uridine(34) 5-carboxymethylaminomethyl modification radical SAM/GNAT enzyme Elp3 [Thermoplasmata archaeon]|nr:tRNA uridine(34) 5-carboxymethylaminomethyl modification radical SAM/GNAT enzyme Elp3 [Thermoplasmata archaeon]